MHICTTLRDLTDAEIVPARNSVEPNFDVDGFVSALPDAGLVARDDTRQGFQLLTVDDPARPDRRFWGLVAEFDSAALDADRELWAGSPASALASWWSSSGRPCPGVALDTHPRHHGRHTSAGPHRLPAGSRTFDPDELHRVAAVFGMDLDDMMG